jgi:ER-bound oxygenase mpaB/B'/Rubber oxygenase, catalytic domain
MPAGTPLNELTDSECDYLDIFGVTYDGAFGWDVTRALELAFFHAFAAPAISELLDRTGEFARDGQKRYDDTVALLREIAREGPASPRGRSAIRRLNWIHRRYDIGNDDLLYVLATFVVLPVRWISRYGWRDLTEVEVRAAVNYYRDVGRLMGIRGVPVTYAGFAGYLDAYESAHHCFREANRRLAVSLIEVFEAWFPRAVRPLVSRCIAAALGRPVRRALGLPEPSALVRAGVHAALRTRAVLMRLCPPLRTRRTGPRRLRSYPRGYALSDLGPAWATGNVPGRPNAATSGGEEERRPLTCALPFCRISATIPIRRYFRITG